MSHNFMKNSPGFSNSRKNLKLQNKQTAKIFHTEAEEEQIFDPVVSFSYGYLSEQPDGSAS